MITVSTNFGKSGSGLNKLVATGANPSGFRDKLLRAVSSAVFAEMKVRIHKEGKASDGNQIGAYTPSYLKTRTKKYKRTGDSKVIISLTRQMENDFSILHDGKDYGLGYKNDLNRNKVDWVEDTYNKAIFKMTEAEKELANKVAREELHRLITQR